MIVGALLVSFLLVKGEIYFKRQERYDFWVAQVHMFIDQSQGLPDRRDQVWSIQSNKHTG